MCWSLWLSRTPSAPDYLLAQRVGTQTAWQKYITQYPNANHTDDAKRSLSSLYLDAGAKALANYEKSTSSATPSYSELEAAETAKNNAHALLPNSEGEVKLRDGITTALSDLVDRGRAELAAYSKALNSSTAGYVHLQRAKELSDEISTIGLNLRTLGAFQLDVMKNLNALNAAIRSADSEMEKEKRRGRRDEGDTALSSIRRRGTAYRAGHRSHLHSVLLAGQGPGLREGLEECKRCLSKRFEYEGDGRGPRRAGIC